MPPKASSSKAAATTAGPRRHVVTDEDRVRVCIRVRPPMGAAASTAAGTAAASEKLALPFDERANTCDGVAYDSVLGPSSTQAQLFAFALPIVDMWIAGYNASCLCYGATSHGKSYSMLGPDGGKSTLDGVIPQTVAYALSRLDQERRDRAQLSTSVAWNARLQASYVELYENQVRDLIRRGDTEEITEANVDSRPPAVREDANGVVFLQGVAKETIESPEQLMRLVRLGSKRRAMGRNYVHEHSSRSHAVLTLYLECRWKDTATCADGMVKSSTSVLQLVDLAGAEFAAANTDAATFRQSVAICTSLFALGNVISALAGHRERRVGNHIPYRDSLLTRLLQSALGGDARTALIVCVSPEQAALGWSRMSLAFASNASKVRNVSRKHEEMVEEIIEGPYTIKGDLADPDPRLDRRALFVETEYGDVFCRVLGPLSGDLILFVHGSGPTNSGAFWNSIVWELACRMPERNYCYVAMDCPGYGRSRGDRQHIRSSPGGMIASVIYGLGKRDALCLVGSSQGAAAVFNAALEFPRICRRIAVIHPVGHDPSRYTAIRQPTLLTFDDEDAGHPVSVGLIMKKNIPFNIFHRYKCSEQPYWESEHTASEIIKLINWNPQGAVPNSPATALAAPTATTTGAAPAASSAAAAASGQKIQQQKLTGDLWRLAGGIVAWCESWGLGSECADLCYLRKPSEFLAKDVAAAGGGDDELEMGMTAESSSTLYSDEKDSVWRAHIDAATQRVFYINESSRECKWSRPKKGTILRGDDDGKGGESAIIKKPAADAAAAAAVAATGAAAAASAAGSAADPAAAALLKEAERIFREANAPDSDEDVPLSGAQLQTRTEKELQETHCSCCAMPLWRPERGRDCRHAVCGWCFAAQGSVSKRCPTCRKQPYDRVEGETKEMHQHVLESVPRIAQYGASVVDAAMQLRRTLPKMVLEFGNTAQGSAGASFLVEASIRCTGVSKGVGKAAQAAAGNLSAASVISKVGFDINPSFPKSAVKVTAAPFKLVRDMATPFTCAMQVSFAVPCLSWLTLVLPYAIHHVKEHRDRVAVYIVPSGMAVPPELMAMQPLDPEAPAPLPCAIVNQAQPRQAPQEGRAQLPAGWFRLPDIDFDECAVTECFVVLK